MSRTTDILLTALAPAIWGSTYLATTETLPSGNPATLAALRALPAGLLLLSVTRCVPPRAWLARTFVLGSLNFALFCVLLFVAAYRLPSGVAATLGALQAMMVIGMAPKAAVKAHKPANNLIGRVIAQHFHVLDKGCAGLFRLLLRVRQWRLLWKST